MTPWLRALLGRARVVAMNHGHAKLTADLERAIADGDRENAHRALVHSADVAKGNANAAK